MGMTVRDRTATATTLSEINVTPLVDVMLVLLIIFMVTAPMLSAGVDVNLQKASTALPSSPKEHVIITITKDRRFYVAEELVHESRIVELVQKKSRLAGIAGIGIRADRAVDYGTVLGVLEQLRGAGIKGVGLVMSPPEPAPSPGKRERP